MSIEEREKPLIKSKNSFYLGLVTGVAVVSLIGIVVISGQVINKGSDIESDDGEVVVKNTVKQPTKPSQPTPSAGNAGAKVDIKVASTDRIRGNKNAPITIVEFSDYQCPYCSKYHDTMKQVMQNYPDKVRWVYKHFPLESMHPYAKKAAEGAECAGDQGKFWEFTDDLLANQGSIKPEYLSTLAQNLGLKTDKFENCLSTGKYTKKVENDMSEGKKLGVRGTPGSFINGRNIAGAVPYADIEAMIEAELNN
ncbi:MAG: DSBA oxidoreductase [Candidatus Falkowbacteria bacterium GW2011_GWF2_39_8]|uniref:DSBA oxidoreductase n=1 Tax=Candidatus Falkowbacteria bacterium GW2011_GWF2_39_8 TaxID=1618642 RepID=A0A0G0PWN7_9BACT|nr:MAG: DSBA oxidoreductase [Candidatus Falkowbacteria bacterium GW2011_GWF2_39_8]